MKSRIYTFKEDLKERLKDPEFKKVWEDSEPEYMLADSIIRKTIQKKINYKQLARKAKITNTTLNNILFMNANPLLSTLKKISQALDSKIVLQFK